MLLELHEELTAMGSRLQIVEARFSVRQQLRQEGLEEKVG